MLRDETAGSNSRDQRISCANGDRENDFFLVQLTTRRIDHHTFDVLSAESDDHVTTHTHTDLLAELANDIRTW